MSVYTDEFIAKCRRMMEARTKRDNDKAAAKQSEADYRELEAELWDELAPDDPNDPDYKLSAIKVPLGPPWGTVSFTPKETPYAKIIDDEAALKWAEERQLVDELTSPRFVMKRMNEEVREARDNGSKLPDGTDFYMNRYVTITIPKT